MTKYNKLFQDVKFYMVGACIITGLFFIVMMCSGCALGAATSATSGYALRAKTAEELTSTGEKNLMDKVKEWVRDNFKEKD